MENKLSDLLKNTYKLGYVLIDDQVSLEKIYYLFTENKAFEPVESIEIFYYGVYNEHVEKDYEQMKIYYLKAIEKDNVVAMNNLANYYQNIEKNYEKMKIYYLKAIEKDYVASMNKLAYYYQNIENYEQMKIYYLKAIEKDYVVSMNNLAYYYQSIEKDYEKARIYYIRAIDRGDVNAINNLACYYENIEKDYEKAKKYYLKAIDGGNVIAMNNLAYYYENIEKNYEKMETYYLMAIDGGNTNAMVGLISYYDTEKMYFKKMKLLIKYHTMVGRDDLINSIIDTWKLDLTEINSEEFIKIISEFEFQEEDNLPIQLLLFINSIKNQVNIMDMHFTYTINGKGYEDAIDDYAKLVSGNPQ